MEKSSWERNVDTALAFSLKQLESSDNADMGEIASLEREAELLKSNFNREAYCEVLEQEKAGDDSNAVRNPIFNTERFGQHILKNPLVAQGSAPLCTS